MTYSTSWTHSTVVTGPQESDPDSSYYSLLPATRVRTPKISPAFSKQYGHAFCTAQKKEKKRERERERKKEREGVRERERERERENSKCGSRERKIGGEGRGDTFYTHLSLYQIFN